jgi:hypothetical protein
MVEEISQAQKAKYHMFICEMIKMGHEYIWGWLAGISGKRKGKILSVEACAAYTQDNGIMKPTKHCLRSGGDEDGNTMEG